MQNITKKPLLLSHNWGNKINFSVVSQNEDDVEDFDAEHNGEEDVGVEDGSEKEGEEGEERTDGGDEVQEEEEEEVGDDGSQKVNLQSIKHKVRPNFFPKKS